MARCDPMSPVDSRGETRVSIGLAADNRPVYEPFPPKALSLANELTHLLADGARISQHAPIPDGVDFIADSANSKLQLRIAANLALRFRRLFGYLGEIQLAKESLETVSRAPP